MWETTVGKEGSNTQPLTAIVPATTILCFGMSVPWVEFLWSGLFGSFNPQLNGAWLELGIGMCRRLVYWWIPQNPSLFARIHNNKYKHRALEFIFGRYNQFYLRPKPHMFPSTIFPILQFLFCEIQKLQQGSNNHPQQKKIGRQGHH